VLLLGEHGVTGLHPVLLEDGGGHHGADVEERVAQPHHLSIDKVKVNVNVKVKKVKVKANGDVHQRVEQLPLTLTSPGKKRAGTAAASATRGALSSTISKDGTNLEKQNTHEPQETT
jgi:hypothetical protein